MDQPYVLLAEWEPENLLEKGVDFLLKRRDLVREIRIHLAKVELKGLQADLEWEMLESWKQDKLQRYSSPRFTSRGGMRDSLRE